MIKAKVAVIGGTGFIGYHIVNDLIQRGYDVTIMSRTPPKQLPSNWQTKVNFFQINVEEASEKDFQTAFEGHQGVIYASGGDPGNPKYWEKNVDVMKQLIGGAKRANCDRAVILSSYYTSNDLALSKELRTHKYVKSRIEQAKLARELGGEKVAISVIQIPWVFGVTPGHHSKWKSLIKWANSNIPVFAPNGGTAVVSVETVAGVTAAAFENRSTKDIPVAEKNLSWIDILKQLSLKQRSIHKLPNWLLSTVGYLWKLYTKISGKEFPGLEPHHFLSKIFTRELYLDLKKCREYEKELGLISSEGLAEQQMLKSFENTIQSCMPVTQPKKIKKNTNNNKIYSALHHSTLDNVKRTVTHPETKIKPPALPKLEQTFVAENCDSMLNINHKFKP